MARAYRYLLPAQICHVTHRCHRREFLLRFGQDRDVYLHWLREGLRRHGVTLLGYCLTCNHVHLVLHATGAGAISELMQLVEGQVAGQYNRRKGGEGAFWSDRFHGTLIDTGEYLWNCLTYVDLNMARARAVADPSQWRWCSYAELLGCGVKKPLVDRERVAAVLGCRDVAELRERWVQQIRHSLEIGRCQREGCWTESVAVGRREYVEWVATELKGRQRWRYAEQARSGLMTEPMWSVRETPGRYDG